MHVANIQPTNSFKDIEELISTSIEETGELSDGKSYIIHNNGGENASIVVQQNPPAEYVDGYILSPGKDFTYKKGVNKCYVKSCWACDLHIEEVE